VKATQAFLAGTDDTPLQTLEREMTAAAETLVFERAAALRDKLEVLRWLRDHLERLRLAREQHSFIYPVRSENGQETWYLICHGRVAAALPAPHDEVSRARTAAAVANAFHEKQARSRLLAVEEVDGVLLVAGWFRRYPEERARTLDPEHVLKGLS
jgi:excinuclease UvrABC nuclease subunit